MNWTPSVTPAPILFITTGEAKAAAGIERHDSPRRVSQLGGHVNLKRFLSFSVIPSELF